MNVARETTTHRDLYTLAHARVNLFWAWLLLVLSPLFYFTCVLLIFQIPGIGLALGILPTVLLPIFVLGVHVFMAATGHELELARGASNAAGAVGGVLCGCPFVNLAAAPLLWIRAYLVLKQAGAGVPFLSLRTRPLRHLESGRCRGCGYSLAGLSSSSTCPECGAVPLTIHLNNDADHRDNDTTRGSST